MTEDKYYKPELHVVPDIDIPKEDSDSSPLTRLGNGDTLSVRLDSDVIIQKLSHDIYSGWKSGLRELYNNEARACRITAKQHLTANPTIHITIDPIERQLTIEGIDSQGITVEVFDKSLRVLGVSSNFDSKEIGQMGMGFAGYTMIFEAMKLDSYARDTNEKWSVLADGGINFKVLGNPTMNKHGTRLSGTYKDSIDVDEMFDHIKILSRFSKINTIIHLTEDTRKHNAGKFLCDSYRGGYHYLMGMRAEYLRDESDYRAKHRDKRKELFIPITIEREDFDFYGYVSMFNTTYDSVRKEDISDDLSITTLIGTPIDSSLSYKFGNLSGYVLNIKDERKYKPTTDRDRMKDESIDLIEDEIENEIKRTFIPYHLASLQDYMSLDDRQKMLYDSNVWREVDDFIDDDTTQKLVSMLNASYTTYPNKRLMSINEMLKLNKDIVALKGLRKEPIEKLSNVLDDPLFFRLGSNARRYIEREDELQMLREFGVIMGEEYIRLHKVKGVRTRKKGATFTDCSVRLYSRWNAKGWGSSSYGASHTSHLISEINDNQHDGILRVTKGMWSKCENYNVGFIWVRDRTHGFDGVKTIDERFRELENIMFEVNSEKMLFKDIPKGKTIFYCDVHSADMEFNLNELRLDSKSYAFIYPAEFEKLNTFFSSVPYMMDIIDMYCYVNGTKKYGAECDLLKSVRGELNDRLDLTTYTDRYNDVPLNKMIRLNRFKDLIPDNDPLYQLTKQAMLESDEDQSLRILKLGLELGGIDV
jgi:hypothetical protein